MDRGWRVHLQLERVPISRTGSALVGSLGVALPRLHQTAAATSRNHPSWQRYLDKE